MTIDTDDSKQPRSERKTARTKPPAAANPEQPASDAEPAEPEHARGSHETSEPNTNPSVERAPNE